MDNDPDKDGLAFSFLTLLNGATDLPGFIVVPDSHKSDKEYFKSENECWFPNDINIAGCLHDIYSEIKYKI